MTEKNDKNDKKFVRIAKNLGLALMWVSKVISRDDSRPALTMLHVEPRLGKYGMGVILGTDGFRLHLAQNINIGKTDEINPWRFEERLDLGGQL